MNRHLLYLAAAIFTACSLSNGEGKLNSADIHLSLSFDTLMEHILTTQATRSDNSELYDVRHTIYIYGVDENGVAQKNNPITNRVITTPTLDTTDLVIEEMAAGKYCIAVWTDYVDKGSNGDKFYSTERFPEIKIKQDNELRHIGSCEFRDAFCGTSVIDIQPNAQSVNAHICMHRPLAKYEIITHDLEELTAANPNIDINNYQAVIRHSGFMPNVFSIVQDDPIDAIANASFISEIEQIDSKSARIGFDYIFSGSNAANIKLSVSVYNKDNQLISSSNEIIIPIERNKLTNIEGKFMTLTPGM